MLSQTRRNGEYNVIGRQCSSAGQARSTGRFLRLIFVTLQLKLNTPIRQLLPESLSQLIISLTAPIDFGVLPVTFASSPSNHCQDAKITLALGRHSVICDKLFRQRPLAQLRHWQRTNSLRKGHVVECPRLRGKPWRACIDASRLAVQNSSCL